MIEINGWLDQFLQALDNTFGKRVWFVGLQGSYGRGEATETSDLDMVVILDELSGEDIRHYDAMLNDLPNRELICGFLSGRQELMNWEPSDLFQFFHDTKPIRGSMDALLSVIDDTAVNRAIRIGVCNIYHGCVHNMLHEKSGEILTGLYKSASFVVQAICYRQTGRYISRMGDLIPVVADEERVIAETYVALKNGGAVDFQNMSENLFLWCRKWISGI